MNRYLLAICVGLAFLASGCGTSEPATGTSPAAALAPAAVRVIIVGDKTVSLNGRQMAISELPSALKAAGVKTSERIEVVMSAKNKDDAWMSNTFLAVRSELDKAGWLAIDLSVE